MSKKKALIVTQEMQPYTALSEIASIARKLPQYIQEKGMEIRVLMPRFGTINERRHRLHEVVRLSGMNIIVDDDDFPLIIKVASLPGARMQVYFLDNEDFFSRKSTFTDKEGKLYDDNAERTVFFCRGVLETVRKFGWAPDIVHCHGWMTSLVPMFMRTAYKQDPIFENSKLVYSIYDKSFEGSLPNELLKKAQINRVVAEDLTVYGDATYTDLEAGAISYSDALVKAVPGINAEVEKMMDESGLPLLQDLDEETFVDQYLAFYDSLLEEEVEEEEEATVED